MRGAGFTIGQGVVGVEGGGAAETYGDAFDCSTFPHDWRQSSAAGFVAFGSTLELGVVVTVPGTFLAATTGE